MTRWVQLINRYVIVKKMRIMLEMVTGIIILFLGLLVIALIHQLLVRN